MNIKSLLLGSATAFAVVSGAQAADAIVAAAPEPMEYVKVCDAFGTGYFFIPGTETCLKISGAVRWQLNYSQAPLYDATKPVNSGYKWSSFNSGYGKVEIDAKNATEVGTVYSWLRIQGNNGFVAGSATTVSSGNAYNGFNAAFYAGIDAGSVGFEVGSHDTYWHRNIVSGGLTDDGGNHKGVTTSYAAVYGKAGMLTWAAGVDDFSNVAGKTAGLNAGVRGVFNPNFTAGLGINYDIAAKAFGVKGFVDAKFDPVQVRLIGIYSASATSQYAPAQGFSMVVGGKVNMTSQLFAAVDYSYSFTPKTWYVVGDIGWNVAKGFDLLGEVKYTNTKVTSGFLRVQRSF